eukprot:jgi/Tetstr1/423901/TSEL_014524.t1
MSATDAIPEAAAPPPFGEARAVSAPDVAEGAGGSEEAARAAGAPQGASDPVTTVAISDAAPSLLVSELRRRPPLREEERHARPKAREEKRRAAKKEKKKKKDAERSERLKEQAVAEVLAPEALRVAMEASCASQEELWLSTSKWDPETAALLDKAMHRLVNMNSPTRADKEARLAILDRISTALQAELGQPGVYVEPYGSFTTGIYNASSDLDIALEVIKILKKHRISRGYVEIIRGARVPIIKFVDAATGIPCDLCVGNGGAAFKSEVLGYLATVDPRFVQLTVLVKKWAKAHGINNPSCGTFNSFALTLMVTFYLQTIKPAALPPLCDLFAGNLGAFKGRPLDHGPYGPLAGAESLEVARTRAIKFKETGFGGKQNASLAELFAGFVVHMGAALSWWNERGSGSVRISAWAGLWTVHPWEQQQYLVSVEDPFDAAENCARTLGVRQMAAKDRTLQKVVDLFHWTEDGLRELGPTTGLASVLDELFGDGTAAQLPAEWGLGLAVRPKGARVAPKTTSPQQRGGGLKAGDVNFRDSDTWKARDAPLPQPSRSRRNSERRRGGEKPPGEGAQPVAIDPVALAGVSLGSINSPYDDDEPPPGFGPKFNSAPANAVPGLRLVTYTGGGGKAQASSGRARGSRGTRQQSRGGRARGGGTDAPPGAPAEQAAPATAPATTPAAPAGRGRRGRSGRPGCGSAMAGAPPAPPKPKPNRTIVPV